MIDKLKQKAQETTAEDIENIVTSKYFIGVFVIAAVGFYLRFANSFFTGMWVDEARYARMGEEIARHLIDYRVHPDWHGQITGHPPVFSYLVALSNYIFSSSEFAARIVSPVVSTVGIVLAYLLGRETRNRTVGLLLAAFVALNPVFWFLSTRILIGATLTTIYTASIILLFYGLEDRKYSEYAIWALGPVTAIALITKQPAYTLGLVIPMYFVYRKWDEFHEYLFTDTDFSDSKLKQTLTQPKYYIGAGLGAFTLLPWMLRNQAVCGFPLCGVVRALSFAGSGGLDIQGTFYFIFALPNVISIPLTAVVGFAVMKYFYQRLDDADFLIKYVAVTAVLTTIAGLIKTELIPITVLTSIAAVAPTREEKLMWLWIGTGIGFMSIPATKVPRYIVFTVPALLAVASYTFYDAAAWISQNFDTEIGTQEIVLAAAIPFLAVSFLQGSGMVTGHSFQAVEPAGEWFTQNTPEDTRIAASSARQIMFYAYPRYAEIPQNVPKENFTDFLKEGNMTYVEVDVYERVQPEWMMTDIPPYKLPRSMVRQLQRGSLSVQDAYGRFSSAPEYLEPVASFGQTSVPLVRNRTQPQAIVYRVNQTALP